MGFKSKKQSNSGQYRVNNIIFPSFSVYQTIKNIDRHLRFLYSPSPQDSLWPTINYSSERDSDAFIQILNIVEINVNEFKKKVDITETDDAAFNQEFLGIVNFLYEASDFYYKKEDELSKKIPESIKKRFISIADKLWDIGIYPGEF